MGSVRVMFTVVVGDGEERDVTLYADAATPVGEIADLVAAEHDRNPGTRGVSPHLYVGEMRLDPALGLGASPLRDGCRVSLDRPNDGPMRPPIGSAEAGTPLPPMLSDEVSGLIVHRPSRRASSSPPKPREFPYPTPPKAPSSVGSRVGIALFEAALLAIGVWASIGADSVIPLLIFGGIAALGALWSFQVHGRNLGELREHHEERARIEQRAKSAREDEQAWWDGAYPGPSALSAIVTNLDHRLWERRRADPDYLELRAGSAVRASSISLSDPGQQNEKMPLEPIHEPVAVRLTDCGVLGVVGFAEVSRAVCRWLIMQIAVLHSPADVRICLLTGSAAQDDWAWGRWLPHCRPWRGSNALVWVGNDTGTVSARISELLDLIESRWADDSHDLSVVVVFDDWRWFHALPGAIRVLRDGPAAGVYAVCVETSERRLPAECGAIITSDTQSHGLKVRQAGGQEVDVVRQDLVDPAWCERVARDLAPLRDADTLGRHGLPETSRLIDVLGLNPPVPEEIVRRWSADRGTTSAVIGESDSGPFSIDLRRDGPHGLLAGTTGSGKSELLQTIVASFASANSPDAFTFLLIDYKGGSVFRDLEDLPHTVGVIVDFDSHQGQRVLTSLAAELRRREAVLRQAGTVDIDDYTLLRNRRPELWPLPRLVIVVDEFAAMISELPDLVTGLVNVAQRGRSLGVHLLLATQRPAGAVSADIRSNTNLRIALRVTDQRESLDVVDVPDASFLPRALPGRAYVRTRDGDPVLVQTCRVGGRTLTPEGLPPRLIPIGWPDLGRPKPRPSPESYGGEPVTDLKALVAAIRQASDLLRIPPPYRPWLPELPGTVPLSELEPVAQSRDSELPPVPYGLEDLPSDQAQRTAMIDFGSFGHLLAAGDRRSGRSQLLRTIAGSIAATASCADVHIYGIDCGEGALLPLAALPHCGAVVTAARVAEAARLIGRLGRELDQRQELLTRTRFDSIGEQHVSVSPPQRLPRIVVMLDRWEGFTAALGNVQRGELTEEIMRMLAFGRPLGMHLVITGDRSVLLGRIAALAEDKLAFRLADRIDYTLLGLRTRDLQGGIPAGRAFRGGSGTEIQVALLDGEPTGTGQETALRALADRARMRDVNVAPSQRPFRVDRADLASDRFHVGDTQGHPVGREDVLAWLRARHAAGGCIALLGPRRVGKTWVLRELERRLAEAGRRQVRSVTIQLPSSRVETPDQLARILDSKLRNSRFPADELLDQAGRQARTADRLAYLLDEVGRLAAYGPAAVSWLRDLGQAGAWLVYAGTEKDWHDAGDRALQAPGSSFGNDVDARTLGPLDEGDAITFLIGTAANLRIDLDGETAARIIQMVGSWPFYLQVVGDAVVRAVQDDDRAPLSDEQSLRDLVDSRLLDGWMTHFQGRWAEIGPVGRSALLTVPGRSPGDLAPGQRGELRDVGLLLPGDRWLDDRPFFGWIARNATALRDGERR